MSEEKIKEKHIVEELSKSEQIDIYKAHDGLVWFCFCFSCFLVGVVVGSIIGAILRMLAGV